MTDRPGGTCALAGCQPQKWFYEGAEAIAKSRHLEGQGIVAAPEGNWARVLEQKRQFTSRIPEGTIRNLQEAGIDLLPGTASFLDDITLSLDGKTDRGQILRSCDRCQADAAAHQGNRACHHQR